MRVNGVPNIYDVGDTQAALDHGLPHFAKERDLISGFVCNYVVSRCDTAFRTRVKALFKVSGVDATTTSTTTVACEQPSSAACRACRQRCYYRFSNSGQ